MHYNEFKVVEFARKLIKADEEALANDDDDDIAASSSSIAGKHLLLQYKELKFTYAIMY